MAVLSLNGASCPLVSCGFFESHLLAVGSGQGVTSDSSLRSTRTTSLPTNEVIQVAESIAPLDAESNDRYGRKPTHKRDVFHAWMLEGLDFSRPWDMPALDAVDVRPTALVPFSVAMHERWSDYGCFVHFFEDDFRFERVWNDPRKYLPKLARFEGVVMPDFSTCIDFPRPLKMWNAYRNQLLGAWFQRQGIATLPNARHQPGCDWLIEGLPRRSVIAICGRALTKDVDERRRFVRDVRTTVDVLEPTAIVYYGSDLHGVMDYPRSLDIPVWVYPGCNRGALDGGKRGQR